MSDQEIIEYQNFTKEIINGLLIAPDYALGFVKTKAESKCSNKFLKSSIGMEN